MCPPSVRWAGRSGRGVRATAFVGLVALGAGLVFFALVRFGLLFDGDDDDGGVAQAVVATGCNGHDELCDRPLNEVAFAASHNAMSAASEPGWFFASHTTGIREQLEYGMRALLIDTQYGVRTDTRAWTNLDAIGGIDALTETFGQETVDAAQRASRAGSG